MRVLLTRPAEDSAALADHLTSLGYRPLIAPVIAIAPLPVVLPAGRIDGVLVTSAHATAALSAADRESLRLTPAFAVGAASAASVRGAGFMDVRIAGSDAAALRDLVRLTLPRGSRLLYLAGRVRKPALTTDLARDGHDIVTVESYDAVEVPWSRATVATLREEPPDACLHFSRRSAALAVAEIGRNDLEGLLARSVHLCLSSDVAAPLREAGAARVHIAGSPDVTSLLQALCKTLSTQR